MPSRIKAYFHPSRNATQVAAVGTAFDAAKNHSHELYTGLPFAQTPFIERIETIEVQLSSIAGGATKLTMRMSRDAAGDEVVIPDVEGTIATGITTATKGAVVYTAQIPIDAGAGAGSTFYLHFKTDALGSSATVDSSTITWVES